MTDDKPIREALAIVAQMKPVVFPYLAGKGAAVQSVVLIDLLAIWLAGHPRHLRAELLANALLLLDKLVDLEAKKLGT
jgi:hypothetical protein